MSSPCPPAFVVALGSPDEARGHCGVTAAMDDSLSQPNMRPSLQAFEGKLLVAEVSHPFASSRMSWVVSALL